MNILKFKKTPHIIVCNRERKHNSGWIFFSLTYNYFKPQFFFNILFWKTYVFSIKSIIKFKTSPLLFSLQRGKWFCCCRHICRIKFTKSQWVLNLGKIGFGLVKYIDVLLSHILLKVPIVKFWSLVGTDGLGRLGPLSMSWNASMTDLVFLSFKGRTHMKRENTSTITNRNFWFHCCTRTSSEHRRDLLPIGSRYFELPHVYVWTLDASLSFAMSKRLGFVKTIFLFFQDQCHTFPHVSPPDITWRVRQRNLDVEDHTRFSSGTPPWSDHSGSLNWNDYFFYPHELLYFCVLLFSRQKKK